MGSFLAGVKSGTLAGIVYLGGLAIFNVLILYALKAETLGALTRSFAQFCTSGAPTNGIVTGNAEDCFASIVTVLIPIGAFLGFFLSLLYSGIFGLFYDRFPWRSPILRGETMAVIIGVSLLILGTAGAYFTYAAGIAVNVIFLLWTVLYGFLLGRLYRKYSRLVTFQSQDEGSLRVFVDGRDFTGKARTLATKSMHKLRAEVAEDASFKEWEASGGVVVEDPRSFETVLEVNGDGFLRAQGGKKY